MGLRAVYESEDLIVVVNESANSNASRPAEPKRAIRNTQSTL